MDLIRAVIGVWEVGNGSQEKNIRSEAGLFESQPSRERKSGPAAVRSLCKNEEADQNRVLQSVDL